MSNFLKNKKAFTLLEMTLYVGVAAFVLTAALSFTSLLIRTQAKNRTIAEVNEQGALVMQTISRAIQNANSVNSPAIGFDATQLSLAMGDVTKDPTVFSVSSGAFQVQEGADIYNLTNSKVSIVNPRFTNLSRTGTDGAMRIEFTVSYVNDENRSELDYHKTFETTTSLR